ncbi:monocarboxylate transporter 2-like isoform X2 [Colletes latitarsis]|uniref:monocarboxylate transporter 2-like isoform X2 n=1 Tax=Colletes latitarsis TaxID=2605962 RepID=UPI0040368E48
MVNVVHSKKKAPDGGWGWFVCLGSSLITLSLRSLDPSFGLLFHDPLEELDVDSTGTSLIMSILDSIVNFSGLLIGPLLKKYSYRQVAFFGSLLSCTGLILTSRANSMFHIICTYSILGGLGTGLAIASSFVALNTFFDKKRGQAVGFSMAGTTLAMMLVPQFIHLLLAAYGFRGATMIVGAWALHSTVGACLLRPLENKKGKHVRKLTEMNKVPEGDTLLHANNNGAEINLKNSSKAATIDATSEDDETEEKEKDEPFVEKIKKTFDLDLLKDGVYLNVIIGLSLYYVAESNFKLMTPFFLSSIGLSNVEVASCLSITAFTDILARLLLPTIFDRFGFKKRSIFWIFCLLVGIGRSSRYGGAIERRAFDSDFRGDRIPARRHFGELESQRIRMLFLEKAAQRLWNIHGVQGFVRRDAEPLNWIYQRRQPELYCLRTRDDVHDKHHFCHMEYRIRVQFA